MSLSINPDQVLWSLCQGRRCNTPFAASIKVQIIGPTPIFLAKQGKMPIRAGHLASSFSLVRTFSLNFKGNKKDYGG
jgi:hypothetical protein